MDLAARTSELSPSGRAAADGMGMRDLLPSSRQAATYVASRTDRGEPWQVAYVGLSLQALRTLGRDATRHWSDAAAVSLADLASRTGQPDAIVSVPMPGGSEFLVFLPGTREAARCWLSAVLDPASPVRRIGSWRSLRQRDLRVAVQRFAPEGPRSATFEIAALYRELQQAEAYDAGSAWLDDPIDDIIRQGALDVATQPIFDLTNGRVFGFEALVRGSGMAAGATPTDLFVSALRTGRFAELEEACREHTLRADLVPPDPKRLFVNVDLRRSLSSVRKWISERNLPPRRIALEVSEASVLDDPQASVDELQSCRELGMEVALDDVGEGFTGLRVLALFPWDYLKIDRRFLGRAASEPRHRRLLESIRDYAHGLDSRVVAEGIETDRHLALCAELGIRLGQGYLLARPMHRRWPRAEEA